MASERRWLIAIVAVSVSLRLAVAVILGNAIQTLPGILTKSLTTPSPPAY